MLISNWLRNFIVFVVLLHCLSVPDIKKYSLSHLWQASRPWHIDCIVTSQKVLHQCQYPVRKPLWYLCKNKVMEDTFKDIFSGGWILSRVTWEHEFLLNSHWRATLQSEVKKLTYLVLSMPILSRVSSEKLWITPPQKIPDDENLDLAKP